MSKRADLSDEERVAAQTAIKALVVAYGSQVAVGKKLGYTQAAVGKAVTRAELGYGLRDALLTHIDLTRDELMKRYGPAGALRFIGDTRAPGFEGRSVALQAGKKRGICDDARRIVVIDPAFNRDAMRNQTPAFWSRKLDLLHESLTGRPPPRRPEKGAKWEWDPSRGANVVTEPAQPTEAPKIAKRRAKRA